MAEVLGEVGGELFQYNREGWKFGAELRQRDLYQRQKMRIKQVDLYRDDIRDLFDLTVGKMDKYVIVCLVMLSITMELYYKGRNPVGTPSWLFWCWAICTAGAMFYLLMSIWLALHASISAQTFSVRCLTQWLRLPIPSSAEISKGAAKLEEYEQSGSLLRVPVLGKGTERSNGITGTNPHEAGKDQDLTTDWELFTSHFNLFNHLHRKWQGYEAYARVCMCLGMNHFLAAMSYFSLAVYALELKTPWSGWAFIAMFQGSAVLHARLNLNLSFKETIVMVCLVILPSLFLSIGVAIVLTAPGAGGIEAAKYELGPCLFASVGILGHIGWVLFFLVQTKSDINGLPVKFSTVWCIDVLGFGMETLREVQEPVGKSTYNTRLPGYAKDGPLSVFETAQKGGLQDLHSTEHHANPESKESLARSKLPWGLFKIGSGFIVSLWVLAFAQTIVLPFGINTGTSVITGHSAVQTTVHMAVPRAKTVDVHPFPNVHMGELVGILGNQIVADEHQIWDLKKNRPVTCILPERLKLAGISGSVARPYVFGRTDPTVSESSVVVECLTGKAFEVPLKTQAVALVPGGNVVILLQGQVQLRSYGGGRNFIWTTIPNFNEYEHHVSMVLTHDTLTVLSVDSQRVEKFDLHVSRIISSLSVKNKDYHWRHVSEGWIFGVKSTDNSPVIAQLA